MERSRKKGVGGRGAGLWWWVVYLALAGLGSGGL